LLVLLRFVLLQVKRQVAVTAAKKGFGAAESKQVGDAIPVCHALASCMHIASSNLDS
jgi:hypothetical protein